MSNARNIADVGHRILAFAHFDGQSGISGNSDITISPIHVFNVSSVEYKGTGGLYRINFDVDATATTYTVLITCSDNNDNLLGTGEIQTRNTAYVEFMFKGFNYNNEYVEDINILILE